MRVSNAQLVLKSVDGDVLLHELVPGHSQVVLLLRALLTQLMCTQRTSKLHHRIIEADVQIDRVDSSDI